MAAKKEIKYVQLGARGGTLKAIISYLPFRHGEFGLQDLRKLLSKEKMLLVNNFVYKCYNCKVTIEILNALIDTEQTQKEKWEQKTKKER